MVAVESFAATVDEPQEEDYQWNGTKAAGRHANNGTESKGRNNAFSRTLVQKDKYCTTTWENVRPLRVSCIYLLQRHVMALLQPTFRFPVHYCAKKGLLPAGTVVDCS